MAAVDEAWLQASSDAEEAAALTAHLVSFRSYPGEEGTVQRAVAAWMSAQGMHPIFMATQDDRPNVLVRLENGPGPTYFSMDTPTPCLRSRGGAATRGRAGATATGCTASARAT